MSSHSGSRILNCTALEPTCFVFDTKTGWNDAKIDLFYLSVITGMDVKEGETVAADQLDGEEEENEEGGEEAIEAAEKDANATNILSSTDNGLP